MRKMASSMTKDDIILRLHEVQGLKFGAFTMRTGEVTPVYIDMRVIWSYPDIVKGVCNLMWQAIRENNLQYDIICGLPYQGIPLATVLSTQHDIPMVIKRKKPKAYGTCQALEGHYKPGDGILLLDDVLMTGGTYVEDIPFFQEQKFKVVAGLVFFDREQRATERIQHICNVPVYSCVTISQAFEILVKAGRVNQSVADSTMEYINSNQFNTPEYGVTHDNQN